MKNILFPLLHRVVSGGMEEGILRYTLILLITMVMLKDLLKQCYKWVGRKCNE